MSTSQISDQQFASELDLNDLLSPFDVKLQKYPTGYYRLWRSARPKDYGSMLKAEKDKFEINLDVQQFALDELSVKVCGSRIVVEGKHEERLDEHGSVSRQFIRKYNLPDGYDVEQICCGLSSDGVLNITVPRSKKRKEEKFVTIFATGIPAKPVEKEQVVRAG